jgi:hypothetical protein
LSDVTLCLSKRSSEKKTEVMIVQDNWSWIIGTLTLRFTGVFGVLIILYICMEISEALLARLAKTTVTSRELNTVIMLSTILPRGCEHDRRYHSWQR